MPQSEFEKDARKVWDCIDPCAMLCYCVQTGAVPLNDEVKRTLDAFGWLTPEGFPDYECMQHEFNRNANKNK